jgi:membrane protein DedA with SNARE-associated domain
MISKFVEAASIFIKSGISAMGFWGIVLMMAIESSCIPLPSEIIMPFSGYLALVEPGRFTLFGIALAGALGCLFGSAFTYFVGLYGGRPLLERYGKYILITKHDMEAGDRFFEKYGDIAIFISRLLPVVRTFISLPAGIAKVRFWKFCVYTLTGSFIWCFLLGYVGYKFGENLETFRNILHTFDWAIGIFILAGALYYLYRHLRK